MIRFLIAGAALLAAFLPGFAASSASPRGAVPAPSVSPPAPQWNLKTSQMNADMKTGAFSAPDHVLLLRADGSTVNADRATGNFKAHRADLLGHVSVQDASGTFGLRSASAVQGRGPATLTADELRIDDGAHTYDASGNVHYVQGDAIVDAQKAHLNDLTHQMDLTGKVHVVQGDRTLDSDRATYNTQSGLGEADNQVTITMPGPNPSIATPKPITIKAPKIP